MKNFSSNSVSDSDGTTPCLSEKTTTTKQHDKVPVENEHANLEFIFKIVPLPLGELQREFRRVVEAGHIHDTV